MTGQFSIYRSKISAAISWDPTNNRIPLRDNRMVDVSGDEWIIQTATQRFVIKLSRASVPEGAYRNSIRRWVAHLLRTKSPTVAASGFSQALALFNSDAYLKAAQQGEAVPYLAFSQAKVALGPSNQWQLHYARAYYRWCVAQRFPGFNPDVARKLDGIVVGGNVKGAAVRSADPDKGPLDAMEVASLSLALRAARIQGSMPLNEQAALWLCLAFGANASQYAMMREEDIAPQLVDGQLATTLINVPRHKKRHREARTEFQTRKANRFVGRLLNDLIEENQQKYNINDPRIARPLFWREKPLDRGKGLEEWLWHLQYDEFSRLVRRGIKRLRVISRSGVQLKVSTRRLRYSLASRMVQEGASPYAVAAALDHSDLQNVNTYFDVDDGVVEHINAAVAMELGARAQAFAELVEHETDAINGDRVTARRYFGDRDKDIFEPIGTCGHNAVCNVAAPLGCYVCPKFQAWMDAPHDLVLDHLIDRRTTREQLGLDGRMIGLEDELIAAVAGVISRIAEIRGDAS